MKLRCEEASALLPEIVADAVLVLAGRLAVAVAERVVIGQDVGLFGRGRGEFLVGELHQNQGHAGTAHARQRGRLARAHAVGAAVGREGGVCQPAFRSPVEPPVIGIVLCVAGEGGQQQAAGCRCQVAEKKGRFHVFRLLITDITVRRYGIFRNPPRFPCHEYRFFCDGGKRNAAANKKNATGFEVKRRGILIETPRRTDQNAAAFLKIAAAFFRAGARRGEKGGCDYSPSRALAPSVR